MPNCIFCTYGKAISLRHQNLKLGLALPNYLKESRTTAEKALAGVLDTKWSAGRTVIQAVIEGSPKVEIVRYARKENIDLIVLSTHGRTGLAHVIMGSVAETVVRTALVGYPLFGPPEMVVP
jgi:nucleotide-binding universal stress UspA family protein